MTQIKAVIEKIKTTIAKIAETIETFSF
jgi:hypothetical protein